MTDKENLPMMMTPSDIQKMGFTRTMSYSLLNREDVPVIKIGNRKFVQRDSFLEWLASQERTGETNAETDTTAGGNE